MKKIIILGLINVLVMTAACGDEKHAHEESELHSDDSVTTDEVSLTHQQISTAGIKYGYPEKREISGALRANGVLDVPPQNMVSISVPLGGFLRRTSLLQGKRVKKGELIAVIENPEYIELQQSYLEAKSQLEYAEADYERQQLLARENVNAAKTVQLARSQYLSLDAKVRGLKEKLQLAGISVSGFESGSIRSTVNLYSPINGFVTEVNANIGRYFTPTDILFEIVDTEHLHAELTVFEKDVPKLQIGQRVRFTLANETGERTARIYLIGRQIDSDRTVRVHCHIDEEDIHLLPGMYLKALIESGTERVQALPAAAVVEYKGASYVFTPLSNDSTEQQTFRRVGVILGERDGEFVEIKSPADLAGRRVVTEGAYSLMGQLMAGESEGHGH